MEDDTHSYDDLEPSEEVSVDGETSSEDVVPNIGKKKSTDSEALASPRRRRNKTLRDIAYSLVASAAILSFCLWAYHTLTASKNNPAMDKFIKSMMRTIDEEESTSKSEERVKKKEIKYRVTDVGSERTLTAQFIQVGDSLSSFTVSVTTPPLPELTDIEIVENAIKPPWMERAVIDRQDKFTIEENGDFQGVSPAKIFIVYRGATTRLNAPSVVTGNFDAENSRITAKVMINYGYKELPKDANFTFEPTDEGTYLFYISANITAEKVSVRQRIGR